MRFTDQVLIQAVFSHSRGHHFHLSTTTFLTGSSAKEIRLLRSASRHISIVFNSISSSCKPKSSIVSENSQHEVVALGVHRIFRNAAASCQSSIAARPLSYSEALLSPQNGCVSHFSGIGNGDASNRFLEINLSNEESKSQLCNRLLYRRGHRGFLELDLVLGKWMEYNIYSMDVNGIKALIDVLDLVFLPQPRCLFRLTDFTCSGHSLVMQF